MKRAKVYIRLAVVMVMIAVALFSTAAASAHSADAPSADTQAENIIHVVQRGETLFSIAQRYGTTVQAIQAANGLTGTLIYVGQRLVIPTGGGVPGNVIVHRVSAGETLFSIAQRYGTTVSAIRAANGWGPNHSLIFPGQHVFVPVGSTGGPHTYVVQRGDNLFRIAQRFGTTVTAIQAANGLTGTTIYAGQTLIIPTGGGTGTPRTYVVQRGDYLNLIARKFGVSTSLLAQVNKISNPNLIFPGQVLIIPDAGIYG
ncbi:MAG TPA: LysM peptidoglycan-binding domain-containing protein [Aggregatilineales bacterium]|nr:LysM peptidoglycan-binding domain-containing protein [Chloroflexota bacterium]HOA25184.1 LysM peptidoglycan-binding domain-containing protein [Aggregatilineales bacterium]HPV06283.1 LysM peptidoglycan-binding domain-containing protein [Aggregatilineales bacterium]HQA67023.1 LysM peptidoglycan-binding domain-containing protein [Aggregatilineales bacterium]